MTLLSQIACVCSKYKRGKGVGTLQTKTRRTFGLPGIGASNILVCPKPILTVQKPRYVPPEADFWKVYDVAEGEDKVLLLAFLHTAARRNEMFSLKWEDVDLANSKIRLWTRKRKGGGFEFDWLPLTDRLTDALADHAKSKRSEYVFCDESGTPYVERQRLIPRLCKLAGVKRFTYHAIRHLTASILAQEGLDIVTIQKMLRHKNPVITTIYLHQQGIMKNEIEKAFAK